MREGGIIFNGPMVRATLEGRKTQTRRAVKFREPYTRHDSWPFVYRHKDGGWVWTDSEFRGALLDDVTSRKAGKRCPHGQPSDRLWVRENFYVQPELWAREHGLQPLHYAADIGNREEVEDYVLKPSIHMPRWASRITLEITDIRIERLQEISEDDALAEGCQTTPVTDRDVDECVPGTIEHQLAQALKGGTLTAKCEYMELWDSINAQRGFGWDVNPWVWVIEFRRLEPGDLLATQVETMTAGKRVVNRVSSANSAVMVGNGGDADPASG